MVRKIAYGVLALLALVTVLVAGALGLAQTRLAKDQIASLVEGALAGPGQTAEISGLGGLLPFEITLDRFALRDGEGPWLEAERARVAVSATALLTGRVEVEEIGAARVALSRLPPSAPQPEPETTEPFRLPELPQLPESLPVVAIERLHVDRIELGQPILGEAAVFNLEGRAGTGADGRALRAELDLRRLDEATANLALRAGADLAAKRLSLDIRGQETGGLLAAVTKRPDAGNLNLSLVGDGPLDNWRGKLSVDAQRLASLETDLDLAYASTRRIRIDGRLITADGVLPPEVVQLVGQRIDLDIDGGERSPGVLGLDRIALDAGGVTLSGGGAADLDAGTAEGSLTLAVPDLAKASALAVTPLAGAARVAVDATGPLDRPALVLRLEGDGVRAANIALDRLATRFDVALLADDEGTVGGASIAGGGGTEGLAVDGKPVGDGGRVTLDVAATAPPVGEARVERLTVTSSLARAELTARVDRASLAGEALLQASVPDLAAIAALLPPETAAALPLQGAVDLRGSAGLGEQANRIDVDLAVNGRELAGLPGGAADLLGPSPQLTLDALVVDKKALTVNALRLDGAAISLTGNPNITPEGAMSGAVELKLADLAKLERLAGAPTAGTVEVRANLGGTLTEPAVSLDGTGRKVRYADERFDLVTVQADAAGPTDALRGKARLAATRAGQEMSLASAYALQGQQLSLDGIAFDGPGTRLRGDLGLNLDTQLAVGKLEGSVADLAALEAWHRQDLAGAITLNVTATAEGGRQDATANVTARDVAGDFGRLGSANIAASVTDARGAPAVDAMVRAASFTQPDLAIDTAAVTAKGPLTDLAVTIDADGTQAGQPLRLSTAADVAAMGEPRSVVLQRLTAAAAGQDIRLQQPASLTLAQNGAVDLRDLDLVAGPARIAGDLGYGPGRVEGALSLSRLDLASLASFGAPPLGGSVTADLQLSGTPARPGAELTARVADLRLGSEQDLASVDVDLTTRLAGGEVTVDGTFTGLGAEPLRLVAAIPARVALEPFAAEVPQGGALSGSLRGPIDLARVTSFAALDGQRLAGIAQADLGLAGTLAEPGLDGTLRLNDGIVQDATSGIVLRDVTLALVAAGRSLQIETLAAKDRYEGSLDGSGEVALADDGPRLDLTVNTTRLRVLDSDLGQAELSSGTRVTGNGQGMDVRSRLTVDRADINIPDGGGPSVAVLDVTRKGEETGPEPGAGLPYRVGLDVGIDIPSQLFVRGRGLESEWRGKLAVKGEAAAPEITGQIEFVRGFLDAIDKRFVINEGRIAFDGSQPPVPVIALSAGTEIEEGEAIIKLSGPATDPEIELTSEPVLPQDEILARILFGRSLAQITPVQGLRLAAAVQSLQGGESTVGGILGSVRDATGLDTIDVEGGATPQETTATAGKYINDRVYLEAQRGVAQGSGKVRVQVDITPNVAVGTEVTEDSRTGVDLQWKFDY